MKNLLIAFAVAMLISSAAFAQQPFIPDTDDALYNYFLNEQASEQSLRQSLPIDNAQQIDDFRHHAPAFIPDTGDALYNYFLQEQMQRR